jgi:hypothetical protein
MVEKINGQLVFCCKCPEKKYFKRNRLIISLLGILIGIFLLPKIAYLSSITAEKLIELTNKEREKAGINILTTNQLLTQAAYQKAQDIVKTQKFQHNIDGRKFSSWIKEAGYNYSYAGENLAIDFSTSEGIIKAWANSDLHRKNLLNPRFKEIGIATIEGEFEGEDTTIVVQIFGEPIKPITEGQVSSIDSNYLITQKDASQISTIKEENLPLTISKYERENLFKFPVINQSLFLSGSNELILNPNQMNAVDSASQLIIKNNFFEQTNYNRQLINLTIILFIILLVFAILYLYAFYSSFINKLFSIKIRGKNIIYTLKHFLRVHWFYHIHTKKEAK